MKTLTGWKTNKLSFAGCITLAKSVLEAIPMYPMMTNILPKASIKDFHRLQRNFIWGDTEVKQSYHAVSWDTVTKDKKDGGLGMRMLSRMNKACGMKLFGKLINGEEDLWCIVLRNKYKVRNFPDSTSKGTDSKICKDIIMLKQDTLECAVCIIGDGNSIQP